ncbi:glycosyltransferase [Synechococcus sp. BA-124 BA4]|uniref:glycosyltransferase n=1 Tax=Synechococcus sp. BA-124 BA4 TaxID=3110251 RepID=UPI002B1E916E|nr:glycosyltransferase [Synechococcus sp. BA-124 BA4]MEA5400719.1 glycosyltransferase [Synechococcus sp. BA-124 BA4]MEA5411757.1 glycosyltransferase [Synechococcus sp. BA-120 BA3]
MDDDLLDIDGFEVLPHKYANKLRRLAWSKRFTILDWCEELWVSTPVLAERYASLNPVLIPLRPQLRVLAQVKSFSIGYHGTASHRQELLWLYPLILKVQERYSHTLIDLYGDEEMRRLYGSVPRVRVHQPVPWERYLQLTASQRLDCLLCPLMDNGFNRARAAVKFFDAARLGAAGLYSDKLPYSALVKHGEDGLLLSDQRDQWLNAIDRLLTNPQWCERLAKASRSRAYDFVR